MAVVIFHKGTDNGMQGIQSLSYRKTAKSLSIWENYAVIEEELLLQMESQGSQGLTFLAAVEKT